MIYKTKNVILIIILFLINTNVVFGKDLFDKRFFEGRAADVWHMTGSTIGTLAIQKTFSVKWENAALIMFGVGVLKETGDEYLNIGFFHKTGFNKYDIVYDVMGILISYPLKYENAEINITSNKISLNINF